MSNLGRMISKELGRCYVETDTGKPNYGKFDNNRHGDRKPASALIGRLSQRLDPTFTAQVNARIEAMTALICATGGIKLPLVAQSRIVTGIGARSPLMVGLHLDWNLGWPVIPGSGLKGMTLAWLQHWSTEEERLKPCAGTELSKEDAAICADFIFGIGPEGGHRGWAGEIDFLDAVVVPRTDGEHPLAFDVMTPHYNDYMVKRNFTTSDKSSTPADWNDPVPVTYLAIEKGNELVTGLLPRTPEAAALLPVAAGWMTSAFAAIGAGAKTKEGMGRIIVR